MLRVTLLGFAAASLASAAPPAPTPCAAPAGIIPALPESLCFEELAPTNPSGVSVRSYGNGPNATFAVATARSSYSQGIQQAIAGLINYFSGANDEQRNIISARTTPIAITIGGGSTWTAHMEVSPTQFPDAFLIPRPNPGVVLEKVDDDLGLIAVFQFNTTGFPYLENFEEACGVIQNSTIPGGYVVNTTNAWSPTYVFYNGQASTLFTSECWMAVYKQ
jgi:hypothetical protein